MDKDSVVLADVNNIYAFVISRNSHGEQNVTHVGTAKLPYNNIPVSLSNGVICCYTESGKLNTLLLNSHKSDVSVDGKTKQQVCIIYFFVNFLFCFFKLTMLQGVFYFL